MSSLGLWKGRYVPSIKFNVTSKYVAIHYVAIRSFTYSLAFEKDVVDPIHKNIFSKIKSNFQRKLIKDLKKIKTQMPAEEFSQTYKL